MNSNVLFLAMAASAVSAAAEDNWAVIVAGAAGWHNYAAQSSTCRAYHLLKKNGVPEKQIIHLAGDDLADHPKNPFPGKLFNTPTAEGVEGDDVYAGCKIHYRGTNCSKNNVLKVLRGDKSASGPVLGSGPNSRVFFYYIDHGGPGFVMMPPGPHSGPILAPELHDTFKYMHDNKKYGEMVHYMQACHSGSMFEKNLEASLNIYATTSANPHENAEMMYCPPNDMVNGKHLGTCLGSDYDNAWMTDSDNADMGKETLQEQFENVKATVTTSHVQQYGKLDISPEPIGNFQSGGHVSAGFPKPTKKVSNAALKSTVSARDVVLNMRYSEAMRNPTLENQKALADEVAKRMKADKVFAEAFPTFKVNNAPTHINFDCYEKLMDQFQKVCFKFDEYSLKYAGVLAQQCDVIAANSEAWGATVATLTKTCSTI